MITPLASQNTLAQLNLPPARSVGGGGASGGGSNNRDHGTGADSHINLDNMSTTGSIISTASMTNGGGGGVMNGSSAGGGAGSAAHLNGMQTLPHVRNGASGTLSSDISQFYPPVNETSPHFFGPGGDFQGKKNFVRPSYPPSSEKGPDKIIWALEVTSRAKKILFSPLSEEGGKGRGGDKHRYML